MIINPDKMKSEVKNKMRGGEGDVTLLHLANPESMKNARLLSEMTLPPGASIGMHEHLNETEYYIILSGTAAVLDNGREVTVKAGDVVVTSHQESHSIRNTGSVPLKMIAVIITL